MVKTRSGRVPQVDSPSAVPLKRSRAVADDASSSPLQVPEDVETDTLGPLSDGSTSFKSPGTPSRVQTSPDSSDDDEDLVSCADLLSELEHHEVNVQLQMEKVEEAFEQGTSSLSTLVSTYRDVYSKLKGSRNVYGCLESELRKLGRDDRS
uniref:Uncharacterized protein n=1 Tax=Panagrolaimus superbus TaxID=310955 RepID=A0A914YEN2_9BILA